MLFRRAGATIQNMFQWIGLIITQMKILDFSICRYYLTVGIAATFNQRFIASDFV